MISECSSEAKNYLVRILQALGPQIDAGLPVVVLEPSCASVFRDELVNLLPNDARAKKLRAQTFLLSEFLGHRAPGYKRLSAWRAAFWFTVTVTIKR